MSVTRVLLAFTVVLLAGGEHARAGLIATGPNSFGYTGNAIAANLRDISASGTFLQLGDDADSSSIGIGFGFSYFGTTFTNLNISSNGYLDLGGGQIWGFLADLNVPPGNIRYQTLGSPGNREFVVGYYAVPRFAFNPPVTFEMILKEGSNHIEFQYGDLNDNGSYYGVAIYDPDFADELFIRSSDDGPANFGNSGYLISTRAVPEPASIVLLGLTGLGGFGLHRRRRRLKVVQRQHEVEASELFGDHVYNSVGCV